MAQVDVEVNGQTFRIACEDGQEERLTDLASTVNGKVMDLASQVGQVGQHRLLVMAALVIADELVDLRNDSLNLGGNKTNNGDNEFTTVLEQVTKRIENIADQIDKA